MATESFHHETDHGTITLPKFSNLPFGVVRKMRRENEGEQLFMLVEEIADDDTLAVIDQLPMSDIEKLFVAWQEHSGVTAGESSASSNS